MWSKATALASSSSQTSTSTILKQKATIQLQVNKVEEASSTLLQLGEYIEAIELLGKEGLIDEMANVSRKLSNKCNLNF